MEVVKMGVIKINGILGPEEAVVVGFQTWT